jgi:hypothetical protein
MAPEALSQQQLSKELLQVQHARPRSQPLARSTRVHDSGMARLLGAEPIGSV